MLLEKSTSNDAGSDAMVLQVKKEKFVAGKMVKDRNEPAKVVGHRASTPRGSDELTASTSGPCRPRARAKARVRLQL